MESGATREMAIVHQIVVNLKIFLVTVPMGKNGNRIAWSFPTLFYILSGRKIKQALLWNTTGTKQKEKANLPHKMLKSMLSCSN